MNRLTGGVQDEGKDSDDIAAPDKAEEKSVASSLKSVSKMFCLLVLLYSLKTFVSGHPKCKDLVVANRRFSLIRGKLRRSLSRQEILLVLNFTH